MSETLSHVCAYPEPVPILDLYDSDTFDGTFTNNLALQQSGAFGPENDCILATFTMHALGYDGYDGYDGSIEPVAHVVKEADLMESVHDLVDRMCKSLWLYMNGCELY
jgi:hypothetical protein